MVMVVFGHVLLFSFDIGGYDSVISSIFLTFRMPLFFFVSGYIAYKAVELWNVGFFSKRLKKKAFVQIVPAFIFFGLFALCMGRNPLAFVEYGFGGYWFTFVLFEMFVCYFVLSLLGHYLHRRILDVGLIVLSAVGLVVLVFFRGDGQWWTVLCMENFTKYFQFFAFGLLCKKYQSRFIGLMNQDYCRAGIIVMYVVCLLLYFNEGFEQSMPLAYKVIHDVVVRYAGLLLVFVVFLNSGKYYESQAKGSRLLQYVGRRTLDIYLLHYFFLPNMKYLKPWIEPTDMFVVQMVLALAISVLVIGLCLLLSKVIRTSDTLAYWMFGTKSSKG